MSKKITSEFSLKNINLKSVLAVILTLIAGVLLGKATTVTVTPDDTGDITIESGFTMELAEEQVPTVIETADGEVEVIEAPTVESVDGDKLSEEGCGEGEECGKGWWVDTTTPDTFKNAVIGQCIDTDGHFGSQCWDLANLYWQNVADRWLSTCGTGAAKGTLDCWEQNAGNEFEMVWDKTQIKPGDIVVFTNGIYGHIGMALGSYNNGYVALLGTNQGGTGCAGGGSTANIVNISLKSFGGAFRPKQYIVEEPKQETPAELPISNCTTWNVVKGDTMSKIMLECENTVVYGEAMNAYAKTWFSLFIMPGQSVYDGWKSKSGVGLYDGDTIEHRTQ